MAGRSSATKMAASVAAPSGVTTSTVAATISRR